MMIGIGEGGKERREMVRMRVLARERRRERKGYREIVARREQEQEQGTKKEGGKEGRTPTC